MTYNPWILLPGYWIRLDGWMDGRDKGDTGGGYDLKSSKIPHPLWVIGCMPKSWSMNFLKLGIMPRFQRMAWD